MDGPQDQYIQSLILLGTAGMLLLVGGIGFFLLWYQKKTLKAKKEVAEQLLEYQNQMIRLEFTGREKERARIGAELHDVIGSLLWGAKVNASFIQRSINLKDEALTSHTELVQMLDECIDTVRRISWELTPEAFRYSGLSASVQKLVDRLDGKGPRINFLEEGEMHWNDDRALQVFRIIQELVNNALKHSGATTITIAFQWKLSELNLRVSDNGRGFQLGTEKRGIGFWNIDHRIKQLNGKMDVRDTSTSTGAEIKLAIPLLYEKI